MFRLFVNILTPDDKYCLSVKASVYPNKFKCNYLKIKKYYLSFSLHFQNLHQIWNTLKKRWVLEVICVWNYRLEKAELLKGRKSPVLEHLWTVNMLKRPKDCLNLHGSVFVRFFDHSKSKSARKYLF